MEQHGGSDWIVIENTRSTLVFYLSFVASLGIKWFDYACTVSDSYDESL